MFIYFDHFAIKFYFFLYKFQYWSVDTLLKLHTFFSSCSRIRQFTQSWVMSNDQCAVYSTLRFNHSLSTLKMMINIIKRVIIGQVSMNKWSVGFFYWTEKNPTEKTRCHWMVVTLCFVEQTEHNHLVTCVYQHILFDSLYFCVYLIFFKANKKYTSIINIIKITIMTTHHPCTRTYTTGEITFLEQCFAIVRLTPSRFISIPHIIYHFLTHCNLPDFHWVKKKIAKQPKFNEVTCSVALFHIHMWKQPISNYQFFWKGS